MERHIALGLLIFVIVIFTEGIVCMGQKGLKYDPMQVSESIDYEEYDMGEMRELMQDRWEVDVQRDICPWAECTYCPCNGRRPTCSVTPPTPPTEYRGPTGCKMKGAPHTICFFRGGNPKNDCGKPNQDIAICFPSVSSTNDHLQKICLAQTCEYVEEFCDCTRACASTSLPNPHSSPSSYTTARPAAITDRQTVTQTMTTTKVTYYYTSGGSNRYNSDRTVSITTGTPEIIIPSSLSPDIRDNGVGFHSLFSTVGVLALSFCGLVFVCLVFVIMLVCTCSCKSHREPAKFGSYPEQHAYHYVDVDNLGKTDKQGRNEQVIGNPVYDAQLLPTDHEDVGAVYSEAKIDMIVSSHNVHDDDENHYAECRPRSHVSAVPTEASSSAYMELNDNNGEVQSEHLYRVLRTDSISGSVYMDHHLGQKHLSSESQESESDINAPSTAHDDSGSGSEMSLTSSDSGVEDQRFNNFITSSDFEGDVLHSNNATVSDFEGDNTCYFEATTLPFSQRKYNDSFESSETQHTEQHIPTLVQKDHITMEKENDSFHNPTTCSNYQKLRCPNFTKDRSFSIDSACSDNTYNTLTASRGTLTIAESGGKYSTLVRDGRETKRRENESSDNDNMYSELNRHKKY